MLVSTALLAFNRGLVSILGLARVDIKRLALSAQIFTNWLPRVLGSMSIRPGGKYLGSTHLDNEARGIPFTFSLDDQAILELTDSVMRVWVDDEILTRVSVPSVITNGNFTTNLNGWTDNDEAGASSIWNNECMQLTGDGTAAAIRDQFVDSGAQSGLINALRIVVSRGPVYIRVGVSFGDDRYVPETRLDTGVHSIAFDPIVFFCVRFFSRLNRSVLIDSCQVESAGAFTLPTPWTASDIDNVRFDQSGDIVFCAWGGQQRLIERRANGSWSIVLYQPEDGPFLAENAGPVTLTTSGLTGNISLTSSAAFFQVEHIGALFSVTSDGQQVTRSISGANQFSDSIRVTGIDADRAFSLYLTGTWVGTVTVQSSTTSDSGPWVDTANTYTANTSSNIDDGLDNQIVWYRVGIKSGAYTSGTVVANIVYASGSIRGVARVTDYFSNNTVSAEVLSPMGGTTASDIWAEGAWSDYRGWPSAVAFHEGRLWWAGKAFVWGSVSDAFDTFDPDTVGDSGPISRSLATGPVDTINWLISSQRLIIGAQGAEYSARSSSLDEPLTPTQFTVKPASTQGSAPVAAIKIDDSLVFVNRTGARLFEIAIDPKKYDYASSDLTQLIPDIGVPGFTRIAVQRKPDTRIHCVRSDGTVAIAIFDKGEEVMCWVDFETDGDVEDVVILSAGFGVTDDSVYYLVKRTIDGSTVRYLEKWAQTDDCLGDTLNYLADSYITFAGPLTTVTGLDHLEGEDVVVWANGVDIGTEDDYTQTYTVTGGEITLPSAKTNIVVGLPYVAQFQSAKLGMEAQKGTPLGQTKRIAQVSLILADVHPKGLRFGPDLNHLDDKPQREKWKDIDPDDIQTEYDEDKIPFGSVWTTDLRICLQAQAPRPVTVLAVSLDEEIS